MNQPAEASSAPGENDAVPSSGTISRLTSLESHLRYLATQNDVTNVKVLVSDGEKRMAERETALMRWVVGVLVASGVSLVGSLIIGVIRVLLP